jgi:hypothetical protein
MKFIKLLGGVYSVDSIASIMPTRSDEGWHITIKLKDSTPLEVRSNYKTESDRDDAFQLEVIEVLKKEGLLK